ncbi:ribonuclease H-like domain-containing protein [Tanacetum coccineum]
MVTRFHVRTNHPTERLNLHVSFVSPLPKSCRGAFNDPNWQHAMNEEYSTLIKINTWTLVPQPPDSNIVRCMWLFRHKYHADGILSRYKARLMANGSRQLEGVDVDKTFNLVVKPGFITTDYSFPTSGVLYDRFVYLSSNPIQHQCTKHIEIDIHFVRDLVVVGQVWVLHVPSKDQCAYLFTKGLPAALFEEFRTNLSVRCPPALTAGVC